MKDLVGVEQEGAILTSGVGANAGLFRRVLKMYVPVGSTVIDATYGKGAFWRESNEGDYVLIKHDISADGVDFRRLPHDDDSADAIVLDPPYLNGGAGVKESLNRCYRNPGYNSYEAVLRLYVSGCLEGYRVLKRNGVLVVKCQPGIADHVQRPINAHLIMMLPLMALRFEDEFVLTSQATPIQRHAKQQHARKNHSYFLVFRKVR